MRTEEELKKSDPVIWVRVDSDFYYIEKEFNGSVYRVEIYVWEYPKSVKFWVGASSGKKRKDRKIFIPKDNKSTGGLKALLWIKQMALEFPDYYSQHRWWIENKKKYICIHWADNRRRDIYQRLQKEGFEFILDGGKKILRKKL